MLWLLNLLSAAHKTGSSIHLGLNPTIRHFLVGVQPVLKGGFDSRKALNNFVICWFLFGEIYLMKLEDDFITFIMGH